MQLGTAEVIITPNNPVGLPMGGYGERKDLCSGVHDDLWARIFYFQPDTATPQEGLFLITIDSVGIAGSVLKHYRQVFAQKLHIPFDHIIISSTHSHSAFESLGLLGRGIIGILKSRLNTRVINQIMASVLRGMKDAMEHCEPIMMGFVKAVAPDQLGIVRRGYKKIPTIATMIIKFCRLDGILKAVIVNLGAHPTILSPQNTLISADYPGTLVTHLKQKLSEKQKTPITIAFFQGAEGNIAPLLPEKFSLDMNKIQKVKDLPGVIGLRKSFAAVDFYGKYIAEFVCSKIDDIKVSPFTKIESVMHDIFVPIKSFPVSNQLPDVLHFIKDALIKRLLIHLFKRLNTIIIGFLNIEGKINHTYAHVVRLGELIIILSPGELFYEYGEKLMRYQGEASYQKSIIIGLANDYASYLFPVDFYARGGYENDFQVCPLNGPRVVGESLRILKESFK